MIVRARWRHHGIRVGLCVAAMALVAAPLALPAQEPEQLAIQAVDTSEYPTVSFRATVPPALAGQSDEIEFTVSENGSEMSDAKAEHVKGESAPASVVLVVDTSGSMEGRPLTDAKAAAKGFIEKLGPDAQVALVAFSDVPEILSGLTEDRSSLLGEVSGLSAQGETALYDGVVAAAGLVPRDALGQRAVVVLSDGGDTVSAASFEAAVAAVEAAGAPVYAVALESDEYNPQALQTLVQSSSGRLITVAGSAELAGTFDAIAREIQDAFVVTYTSARPRTKDIEVDVTASAGDVSVTTALAYENPAYSWTPAGEEDVLVRGAKENPNILIGTAFLAFISVSMLVVGGLTLLTRERNSLRDLHYYDQLRSRPQAETGGATDQVRARVVDAVDLVAGKRGFTDVIGEKLEQAGMQLRPAEYITFHVLGVVVLSVATQMLTGNFVLSFAVVALLAFGPIVMLDIAIARRREHFEAQLPDILGMISSSLRGGWGLLQAIEFVVAQAGPPAAAEFRRVQTESRLGMPLEEALQAMAARLQSSDFDAAVTAIVIQREVGGNLAEVLDIVSKTVRERAALNRQVSALTAEGRLSALILMALPVFEAVVLSIVSPGYLVPLATTLPGIAMSVSAVFLMFIGAWWLRLITKIEV